MDPKLNNLKQEAGKLSLTLAERTAMKSRIFGMPSPKAVAPKQSPYFIYSFQFFQARVLAPVVMLLVVFVGAGTAAAAQGALPGDVLYSVKLSVNEAVEVALATTPVAKAQVEANLAQRRVQEAEALSAQGELTPDTSATLAASFEAHAEAAQALSDDVSKNDPVAGTALKADLGSSLAAHGAILATLADDSVADSQNANGAASLAVRVLARATPPRAAKVALMAANTVAPQAMATITFSAKVASTEATTTQAPADPAQEQALLKFSGKAAAALQDARQEFNDTKSDLDAETEAQVEAKLADIGESMAQASTSLAAHNYAEARSSYQDALGASIQLSVLLNAQQKLDKNIVSPILEQDEDNAPLSEGEGVGL